MDNFSLTQIVTKWLSQKFRGYTATALAIHWVDSCLTNRQKNLFVIFGDSIGVPVGNIPGYAQ